MHIFRAVFIAPSTASAPELAKKTFSAKVCLQKILANLSAGSLVSKLDRVPNFFRLIC